MPSLEFAWRLAATGAAFAFIFAGGGLLAVTVLPVLALLPGHSRARTQRLIYLAFRFYIGMLQILGLLRLDLEGAEKLRAPGGRLIVANHPSLLDVVLLMARIPKAQCVVKHELWTHPFLGPLMRRAGYIRNDLEPEEMIGRLPGGAAAWRKPHHFPRRDKVRSRRAASLPPGLRQCGNPHRGADPAGADHLRSADLDQGRAVVAHSAATPGLPPARG